MRNKDHLLLLVILLLSLATETVDTFIVVAAILVGIAGAHIFDAIGPFGISSATLGRCTVARAAGELSRAPVAALWAVLAAVDIFDAGHGRRCRPILNNR